MIETMKVSVTTPIATPKIVSDERNLFALTVATAIAADSLMSSKLIKAFSLQQSAFSYSALNASIGSKLEAFQAGHNPLATPTAEETLTPKIAEATLKRSGKPIALASTKASAKPEPTPMMPPMEV